VTPTPIVETSTGKKITERRNPRAMICEVSTTAKSMPRTTLRPLVTTAYTNVFAKLFISMGSRKKVTKLSRPMNSMSNSDHRVRLK